MEPEQQQNFNERLSQWVANQGFWFQIRYSMAGSGLKGRAMFHLLHLGTRLLLFLAFIAAGMLVFLAKRTDSTRFTEGLRKDLQAGLSASALEMGEFDRSQGELEITRLAAEGGEETFFSALEARNIRCKMSLVDGLVGIWKPGVIAVSRLEIDLRAGANDAESARKLSEAVFRLPAKIEASAFEVADTTVRWGYSERTQGAIESSVMKLQRTGTGWRMSFQGGFFSQNWLRRLKIVNLVVACDGNGLVFEKAELQHEGGTADFAGLRLIGGERPTLEGTVKIRSLELEGILPPALQTFVEGSISGDFRVFGSTNTADGIGFEGQIVMDNKVSVSLRDRIHLLKALSDVDYSRNYHRIDFREGSFQMKTTRGGMELSDVKLKAEDLFTLEGRINVRLPTQQEIQEEVAKGTGMESAPLFVGGQEFNDTSGTPKMESDFSLKRANQEARRVKEGMQDIESVPLFERLGLGVQMRRLQNQESERMSRMLRYEGTCLITIPGDAFERAPRLQEQYPKNPTTGRIPIRVPIEGNLYELTLKQAEDIYQKRQR